MVGINLSSSVEKKTEKKSAFGGSFVFIGSIFLLVAISFGGLRYYIKTLDDKLAGLQATIDEHSLQLHGESVDRVARFDDRVNLVAKMQAGPRVDSQKLLHQLEGLVVPNVKLTKYEYNKSQKFVIIEGETDNLKYVAQQIISFKSESLFSAIKVQKITPNKEGRIVFSFKADI